MLEQDTTSLVNNGGDTLDVECERGELRMRDYYCINLRLVCILNTYTINTTQFGTELTK